MASVRFGAYTRQNDDVAYISVEHVIIHVVWQKVYLFETIAIFLATREGSNANEESGRTFASDRILTQGKRP